MTAERSDEGLASGGLAVYTSDEEAGTIGLRENAGALRASFARLPNIAHRCDAFVDARHPKHLRCVCRIGKMAVVAFKVVDGHGRKCRTGAPLTAMPINLLSLFGASTRFSFLHFTMLPRQTPNALCRFSQQTRIASSIAQ